ncbi:helix-turn-helix domain-containing protein [Mycolicibacterium conceptionense]|uniref:helix-turn-helix domain-containing protein n=1 Tax=Mycolicibacterium conceptionense TaxID=451644 RepID=UPI001A95CAA0|nr:helix-turn-helix domain-containing protein [Mycolicibacterium conceptionense]
MPETAKAMRCGKTTVYSLLKQGELRSVKVAGRRFVTAAEVERFIAEHERVSA